MNIGAILSNKRLGLSNVTVYAASSFAQNVLGLSTGIPIYQQQLVHNWYTYDGPAAGAAEYCGTPDNENNEPSTLRQVSAHDTLFARRNVSNDATTNPGILQWFQNHKTANRIYYIGNEPEYPVQLGLSTNNGCTNNCTQPRDRVIDGYFSNVFNNSSLFWETIAGPPTPSSTNCGVDTNDTTKRIKAEALAYVYLRLLNEVGASGYLVLPPASISSYLDGNHNYDPYWQTFFQKVHSGVTINGYTQNGITTAPTVNGSLTAPMRVLHLHQYSFVKPSPLEGMADGACHFRKGVNAYRTAHYGANASLPLDIMLSEMGPTHWYSDQVNSDIRWAGGYNSFKKGLSYWNSWLHWLLRQGPSDCNLTAGHVIYACPHETSVPPYATYDTPQTNIRNQWYFNSDTWNFSVYYGAPVINKPSLIVDGNYQNSFSSFGGNPPIWDLKTWRRTPFGTCYKVWSDIGLDSVTNNLSTGWVTSNNAGTAAEITLTLPAGYSTIYFPVIKSSSNLTGTSFGFRMVNSNNAVYNYPGGLDMNDTQDNTSYSLYQ